VFAKSATSVASIHNPAPCKRSINLYKTRVTPLCACFLHCPKTPKPFRAPPSAAQALNNMGALKESLVINSSSLSSDANMAGSSSADQAHCSTAPPAASRSTDLDAAYHELAEASLAGRARGETPEHPNHIVAAVHTFSSYASFAPMILVSVIPDIRLAALVAACVAVGNFLLSALFYWRRINKVCRLFRSSGCRDVEKGRLASDHCHSKRHAHARSSLSPTPHAWLLDLPKGV